MSSLYRMVFGKDATAGIWCDDVLNAVDAPEGYSLGRLRDAWLERVDGGYRIAIYTRNGGGNRAHSKDVFDLPECDATCTGCVMEQVSSHPRYLHDRDDTFDCTYATIYYRPSGALSTILAEIDPALVHSPIDTDKRWMDALERLKNATP